MRPVRTTKAQTHRDSNAQPMTDRKQDNDRHRRPAMAVNFAFCLVCFFGTAICDLAQAKPLLSVYAQTQTAAPLQTMQKERNGVRQKLRHQAARLFQMPNFIAQSSISFTHPPITKRWRRIGYNYSRRYSYAAKGRHFPLCDRRGREHTLPSIPC